MLSDKCHHRKRSKNVNRYKRKRRKLLYAIFRLSIDIFSTKLVALQYVFFRKKYDLCKAITAAIGVLRKKKY